MVSLGDNTKITAARVPDAERLDTLPRHFGRYLVAMEDAVYSWLRELSEDYSGGYWHFYELSNGGFYMAPECESLRIRVAGNGLEGLMSGDAAGITACLFALSHLSFRIPNDTFSHHYHELREFAIQHPEAAAIVAATD
jgi:hypothetical protein